MVDGAATLEQRVLKVAVFDNADIDALQESAIGLPEDVRIEYDVIKEKYGKDKQDELAQLMKKYNGAVVRSDTYFTTALDQLPDLKFIARAGIGVNNINVPAASKNGTTVYFAPDSNSIAVSEQVFAQILEFERRVGEQDIRIRAGEDPEAIKKSTKGREIYGKTLGTIGVGHIGSKVTSIALGFGCDMILYDIVSEHDIIEVTERVLGNRKLILKDASGLEVLAATERDKTVKLYQLLAKSDYVTVHIPLTDKTRGYISREQIAKMKDGAVLINDSREGIVDEQAVLEALESGKLRGYITDVLTFKDEKGQRIKSPLFGHKKVLVTPHTCASTRESQINASRMVGESIALYAKSQGKEILRSYNCPTIDETLKESYNLTRITAAFAAKYILALQEKIKSVKVLASGLPSYNGMALSMAAAAGTAYSLGKLNGNSDLPATGILKDLRYDKQDKTGIVVNSENIEGAKQGVSARITLEYQLTSGVTLRFTGQIDNEAEDEMRYAGKEIAGFAGKGTAFYPVQYILVEHDDMPGALATSALPLKYHHFNIEDGQVNLQSITNRERRLLVFPVQRRGEYDPTVPKELLDAIRKESGTNGNVICIDLRDYKSPHAA